MRLLKISVCFAALFLFIASCGDSGTNVAVNDSSPGAAAESTPTPAATPLVNAVMGEARYTEYCVKCHKEDGTGGEAEIEGRKIDAEDLTSEEMKNEPDEEYIEYMTKGIPSEGMPSFKDELSEDEMKSIVAYIRKEIQK